MYLLIVNIALRESVTTAKNFTSGYLSIILSIFKILNFFKVIMFISYIAQSNMR